MNPQEPSVDTEAAGRRRFWRNYLAHGIEGGLYVGGLAFVSADSVLPAMMKELGAPSLVVALMPTLKSIGFSAMPLLTAHYVERLRRVKPFILWTGFFQRLPPLVAAWALFALAAPHPAWARAIAGLAPLAAGLVGGLSLSAWLELTARAIPAHRRASALALRYTISALIGVAAGGVVAGVLRGHPGPRGYALLHLLQFAFLAASFLVFRQIEEIVPPDAGHRAATPRTGLAAHLRGLAPLLRADPQLARLLASRVCFCAIYVVTPFLAIRALEATGQPASFLGALVTAQMAGTITGNLMGARIGDRLGGRRLLQWAYALLLLLCLASLWPGGGAALYVALFLLLGHAMNLQQIGGWTLAAEFGPPERRPTYLALATGAFVPGMLGAAALSAGLRDAFGLYWPLALVGAAGSAAALLLLRGVAEPRMRATGAADGR